MSLTQEEKMQVLASEFFRAKEFLISINQVEEDELDSLTKFHINRALFYCQAYLKDSSFDGRSGYAYFNFNQILFNIKEISYDIEGDFFDVECLVIHEITHLLLYYFSLLYNHKPIVDHNLEFAIFNYALLFSYTNKVLPLRFYDIKEEPNIKELKIDTDRFNHFIGSIKFKNLNELYLKTVHFANKIRTKKKKTRLQKIVESVKNLIKKPRA